MAFDEWVQDFLDRWNDFDQQVVVIHNTEVRAVPQHINVEDILMLGGLINKENWSAVVLKADLDTLPQAVKNGTFVWYAGKKFRTASIDHTPGSPLVHLTLAET